LYCKNIFGAIAIQLVSFQKLIHVEFDSMFTESASPMQTSDVEKCRFGHSKAHGQARKMVGASGS
jgi:hypothetical protein